MNERKHTQVSKPNAHFSLSLLSHTVNSSSVFIFCTKRWLMEDCWINSREWLRLGKNWLVSFLNKSHDKYDKQMLQFTLKTCLGCICVYFYQKPVDYPQLDEVSSLTQITGSSVYIWYLNSLHVQGYQFFTLFVG